MEGINNEEDDENSTKKYISDLKQRSVQKKILKHTEPYPNEYPLYNNPFRSSYQRIHISFVTEKEWLYQKTPTTRKFYRAISLSLLDQQNFDDRFHEVSQIKKIFLNTLPNDNKFPLNEAVNKNNCLNNHSQPYRMAEI